MERGIKVEELLKKYPTYRDGYEAIRKKVELGKLVPVKSSGSNEKRPPLYNRYRELRPKKDRTMYKEELMTTFPVPLDPSYYMRRLQQYEKERPEVMKLVAFFMQDDWQEHLKRPASLNERSFQIFGREKFLKEHPGFLARSGIDLSFLNVYETDEPMAYYSRHKSFPQSVLILENLDPFISLKRKMITDGLKPFGIDIETLVYGGGKRIFMYWRDLEQFGEPYLNDTRNIFYYFGDLDHEGIAIYENFRQQHPHHDIRLFVPAYVKMLEKAERIDLPDMKEQKPVNGDTFFAAFDPDTQEQMKQILAKGKYIPQEILLVEDYEKEDNDET